MKKIFTYHSHSEGILRPLGASLSAAYPLLYGLVTGDMGLALFGLLGAFSFLAYQHTSIVYNVKAISLHGLVILLSYLVGILLSPWPGIAPFVLLVLAFWGMVLVKVYAIPKPGHFFVIMLFATASTPQNHLLIWQVIFGMLLGTLSSLVNGLAIAYLEGLPLRSQETAYQRLSWQDKFYVQGYQTPRFLLDCVHHSLILFMASELAYLLRDQLGYWVLISCAAVLAGEELALVRHRYLSRIVGSVIGLGFGLVILSLGLPTQVLLIMMACFNGVIEYLMPRNYLLANSVINPLVLMIGVLTTQHSPVDLVQYRLLGVVAGSLLAFGMTKLLHIAWRFNHQDYSK